MRKKAPGGNVEKKNERICGEGHNGQRKNRMGKIGETVLNTVPLAPGNPEFRVESNIFGIFPTSLEIGPGLCNYAKSLYLCTPYFKTIWQIISQPRREFAQMK